jgi:hypothetical protein
MDKENEFNLKNIYDQLKSYSKSKQKITLYEFRKYEPLYQKNSGLTNEELIELSKDFYKTIDKFSPIFITDESKEKVLFTLPAPFVPVNVVNNKYTNLINKARLMMESDLPKYKSEGYKLYTLLMTKSQLEDEEFLKKIKLYKEMYKECEKKLLNKNKSSSNTDEVDEDLDGLDL